MTVLEHEEDVGVVLLGPGGSVEFASGVAQRMVRDHFGASTVRLPTLLEDWHRNDPRHPFVDRLRSAPRPVHRSDLDHGAPSA